MEDLVEQYIIAAGFSKDENYFKEMYLKDIENKWILICPRFILTRGKVKAV